MHDIELRLRRQNEESNPVKSAKLLVSEQKPKKSVRRGASEATCEQNVESPDVFKQKVDDKLPDVPRSPNRTFRGPKEQARVKIYSNLSH